MYSFDKLYKKKLKLRTLKYRISKRILPSDNLEELNSKLVRAYVKQALYSEAIPFCEELFSKFDKDKYFFRLLNLYTLTNRKNDETRLKENHNYTATHGVNPLDVIKVFDESVSPYDKFSFVKDYVESKGAKPIFILTEGRGKKLRGKSNQEKALFSNQELYIGKRSDWSRNNNPPRYIKDIYSPEYKDKIKALFELKAPVFKSTKVLLPDFNNGVVSVTNGLRNTEYQPENCRRRVHLFGSSTSYSIGCSDRDGLGSQLQRELNCHFSDITVENHSFVGQSLMLAMNNLTQTAIKPNDIVVFFEFDELDSVATDYIKSIDLNCIERDEHFFIDLEEHHCHYAPKGNKKLAEIMVNSHLLPELNKSSFHWSSKQPRSSILGVIDNLKYFIFMQTAQICESGKMKDYLEFLNKYVDKGSATVGSIAVNCNPITKGHMHLIEYASRKVEKLYIFVIEEDQSFFKFKDRIHLVEQSTKHLTNVTVLPGGRFICTELTYPDYFDKENNSEVIADASMEAWFFCEYIAKKLRISKIFLGEEPNCKVTNQYNLRMKELLPDYNIEVDIIKRIFRGDQAISASKVRQHLKNREFDEIHTLVPEATFHFLKQQFDRPEG